MTKRGRKKRKKAATLSRRYRPHVSPEPAPVKTRPRNERLISELHAAAERHLDASALTLERMDLPNATESIVFCRQNIPLVYVFANKAAESHGAHRTIKGNFREPGAHWAELRALLLELQGIGEQAPEPPEIRQTLTSLPSSVAPELASAALRASERTRTEMRVFPCAVLLVESATKTEIRFEPVRVRPRLLVPFSVRDASGVKTEAALDLTNTTGVIPLVFGDSVDEARITDLWPVVVLAFADLIGAEQTTASKDVPPRTRRRGTPGAAPAAPDTPRSLPRRTGARRSGRPPGSSAVLNPIGRTASYLGSFVAGHRRRLPHGQSCGEEARAAARVYGIELGVGWTWVQPHKRGLPDGVMLRYAWRMPEQLRALAGPVSPVTR
jgi:hypothetical protein